MGNPDASHKTYESSLQFTYLRILGTASLLLLLLGMGLAYFPEYRPLLQPFCHQNPERTYLIGGHLMGFCVRCTSFYGGLSMTMLGLPLLTRYLSDPKKNAFSLTIEGIAYSLTAVASLRYYMKWDDENGMRLIYGLGMGIAAGFLCWRYQAFIQKIKDPL